MRAIVPAKSIASILRWTRRGLFAVAGLTLSYCGYVMADSWMFQRQANLELDRMIAASHRHAAAQPAGEQEPPSAGQREQEPSANQPPIDLSPVEAGVDGLIGRLAVDRLGLTVIVTEGTEFDNLEHAAGHIPGTALPGEIGNVGIAAHRDTFFRPLQNIRLHDVIRVTTPGGEYVYKVVSTKIVDPADVSVLDANDREFLTLVTCYPFYYIGTAPKRFVVRAIRTGTTGLAAPQPNPDTAVPVNPEALPIV